MRALYRLAYSASFFLVLVLLAPGSGADFPRIDWNNPTFTEEYVRGELLIGLRGDVTAAATGLSATHQDLGVQVVHQFSLAPVQHVVMPASLSMLEAALIYEAHPSVDFVEPNYIVRALPDVDEPDRLVPDDPRYNELWGMERIRAPEAWAITTGTDEIVVGVIDTGIFNEHEDLFPNIAPGGYDFANNTADQRDYDGHGTHVAGTIGAVGNNAIGVAGVSWNARMVGLKFLDPRGTTANAIRAVDYAATNTALGIRLTNNSWGGGGFSQALFLAIQRAGTEYGQLFIAAAGNDTNDNDENPFYPASYNLPNLISVAAIDPNGELAYFSNFGANSVHIGAPGVGILSTIPGGESGTYVSWPGTSMAAPHVAGAAALLWSLNPEWEYQVIRNALLGGAVANDNLAGLTTTGGELDVYNALLSLRPLITLDRPAYRSDAEVTVTVTEPALDADVATLDIDVKVVPLDPDEPPRWEDTVTIDRDSGLRFEGMFQLVDGVTAEEFDRLTVSYTDSDGEIISVSVPIDNTEPVITDVEVVTVTDDSVTIQWRTDEPADSRYIIAKEIPAGGLAELPPQGGRVFVSTPTVFNGTTQFVHSVTIPSLDPEFRYFFAVLSEDYAGNPASDPLDLTSPDEDDYPVFVTLIRRPVYRNDMESGTAGWTVTSLHNLPVWQHGIPRLGPASANTGRNVWGTVLDGNYPPLAKAHVESTTVPVQWFPRIQFYSWHEFAPGDFGMVEVNGGAGWQNVTPGASGFSGRFEGSSGGWRPISIDIPQFANSSIRVRFRIETDDLDTAAGWYIDDFMISHVPPPGLNIASYLIHDQVGGDGDGFAEPGETFFLDLEVFNSSQTLLLENISATVTIPSPNGTLIPATTTVAYGSLAPGDRARSLKQIQIRVDDHVPVGSEFTLFHSAVADGGKGPFSDTVVVPIAERDSVFGFVRDRVDAQPVADAIIKGVAPGVDDIFAMTDLAGAYALHGLVPGISYQVHASKPGEYSPSAPQTVVGGQTAPVDFELGKAFANAQPLEFDLEVGQGGVLKEILELDNSDGTIPYEFSIEVEYMDHPRITEMPLWITVTNLSDSIDPGEQLAIHLEFSAEDLVPSVDIYEAIIHLRGNDIEDGDVEVRVRLLVLPAPRLFIDSVRIEGGDGDPFVEPGETLDLFIRLGNRGSISAFEVEGTLMATGAGATVITNDAYWMRVRPHVSRNPDDAPTIVVDSDALPDSVLPFELTLVDILGRETVLDFALTVMVRRTISGKITEWGSGDPVEGALVKARAHDDGSLFTAISSEDGRYRIDGLVNGQHKVSVMPQPPLAAPRSAEVTLLNNNAMDVDFVVAEWSVATTPASITVSVPEGVETNLNLTLTNPGPFDGFVEVDIQLVEGIPADLIGSFDMPEVPWSTLSPDDYMPGELLVRFEEGISAQSELHALASVGAQVVHRFQALPVAHVRVPGNLPLQSAAETLATQAAVRYVEPNYLNTLDHSPNDPLFNQLYGLHNTRQTGGTLGADIRALEAWTTTIGSPDVVIAVVDSGVKLDHIDLMPNVLPGSDFGDTNKVDATPDWEAPPSVASHGTHVAGTIAAVGNNEEGVVGVTWNSTILPLKVSMLVTNMFGMVEVRLPNSATVAALEYAVLNGARISNHSYGGLLFSRVSYDMIAMALTSNHLFVASAGNTASNNDRLPRYPSSYQLDNIISVAATDHDGLLAPFSCFGANSVAIAAPGVDIWSTFSSSGEPGDDTYERMSGTSMAAPHVAGVAGLLQSVAPWASYAMYKQAILSGSRHDPYLEGLVSSAGHLDAVGALEHIQAFWMQIDPQEGDIPSGGSLPISVSLNVDGRLPTGTYKADIIVRGGQNSLTIPVELNVVPAPYPVLSHLEIDDALGGDGDGHAEPGEQIDLYIHIINDGSALYMAPTGSLATSTPGATVLGNWSESTWPGLASSGTAANQHPFRIQLPNIPGDVAFTLTMTHPTHGPWEIEFTIPVAVRHSITGTVRDSSSPLGLPGLAVEYWGAASGRVLTSTDGSYRIDGLTAGDYRVRVLGVDHERSRAVTRTVAGNHVLDFDLRSPDVQFSAQQIDFAVQTGSTQDVEFEIENRSDDNFDFELSVSVPRRVALVSDRAALAHVPAILEPFGWDVKLWTNNLAIVSGIATGIYSTDPAVILPRDLVILDLNGRSDSGRLLSLAEQALLSQYVGQGGRILFTGGNLLTRPDDRRLEALVGADSLDRSVVASRQATVQPGWGVDDFWVDIQADDQLSVEAFLYDVGTPNADADVTVLLTADGMTKLMKREFPSGGIVYYWAGNPQAKEWKDDGIWQDVLRALVDAELFEAVPWLSFTPEFATVGMGSVPVTLQASSAGLAVGLHQAVLSIRGNYPGASIRSIPVTLEVTHPTLRAESSQGVFNWMGQPLAGRGGENASLIQLIYAGPDGVIQPPRADGSTTGDDLILGTFPFQRDHGRIGSGSEWLPDLGRFSEIFGHDLTPNSPVRYVYVRAWDAQTFDKSVAYGDSPLYELTLEANELHDFGSWIVNQVLGYPGVPGRLRDSNGDSIPDGWYILRGMDPRLPIAPLDPSWNTIATAGSFGTGTNQLRFPSQLFLTDELIVSLDRGNNRISTWRRDTLTHLRNYGSQGSGPGQFGTPYGMGKDPNANRFAIADSGNHRIQVFTFHPETGEIAFERQFGAYGTAAGQFNQPRDVAIDPIGRIIVADTLNDRVQVFNSDGTYQFHFGGTGGANGQMREPQGIAVDEDGIIWVVDTRNHRVQGFSGGGNYLWRFGEYGTNTVGQLNLPVGIQFGLGRRVYIADTSNHRIQVFNPLRQHVASLGSQGTGVNRLNFPTDVAPSFDSAAIYVADTWNHRIHKLDTIVDGDGDGMDDTWELLNGLNPMDPTDALVDSDGDGLLNIGEYRIRTNPQLADTSGNGWSDALQVAFGADPNDPDAVPDIPLMIFAASGSQEISIEWVAYAGRTYQIEFTSDLMDPESWQVYPGSRFTAATNGMQTFEIEAIQPGQRYFRPVEVD